MRSRLALLRKGPNTPHRIAALWRNEVLRTVRNGMKGQPEPFVERAVTQARQEADLLFSLVVNANVRVLETRQQREREYIILLGRLGAELRAGLTTDRADILHMVFLIFIETVIILDAAIGQVAVERLSGQPLLFRDAAAKLAEQLKMAGDLSMWFSEVAVPVGSAPIDLEELRASLRSEIDHQSFRWTRLARIESLSLFGTEQELHAALDESIRFFRPSEAESSENSV